MDRSLDKMGYNLGFSRIKLDNREIALFCENFVIFSNFLNFFEIFSNFLKNLFKKFENSQSQLRDFGARLRITFYASENYF